MSSGPETLHNKVLPCISRCRNEPCLQTAVSGIQCMFSTLHLLLQKRNSFIGSAADKCEWSLFSRSHYKTKQTTYNMIEKHLSSQQPQTHLTHPQQTSDEKRLPSYLYIVPEP